MTEDSQQQFVNGFITKFSSELVCFKDWKPLPCWTAGGLYEINVWAWYSTPRIRLYVHKCILSGSKNAKK